ncbi:reverse transcriptase domain-containing protein [Tanacetum coccineum]
MEIVPNKEEVAIDAIPLAVKPPSIVDWKIHKEGKKIYYQIIRADGSSKMYLVFSHMLKSFDKEDLETLWKLVKAKHGSTRPEEGYERVLWGDIKVMFEPHVEDTVWRNQQDYRVLEWKLYDSCRGRIVGIKRLLDDLRVTAAQVCVTAAKLNYYCSKIKTAERVSTVRERIKTEERIKIVWRSRLLT